ncbi:MAG TPA: uroporphyrinogen-III synthase [Saprospiraceae bacterium]|nr:uroporphyrinogen-III synthase [Saprospiraceae bacterium]
MNLTINIKQVVETFKPVRTILITQPHPVQKNPYEEIIDKFGITIDWREFNQVEPIDIKEFRRQRIRLDEYGAVIFTSKNSIEHFFRVCEEMRIKMSPETKYFCISEAIANYLQKFILYRKRKVFVGEKNIADLKNYLIKHRDNETFLVPTSNLGAREVLSFLDEHKIKYQESLISNTVSSDLSDLKNITYDMLVFFSPLAVKSLYDNFPDFTQNETRLAAFGNSTAQQITDRGLFLNINAPNPETPSMHMAILKYLQIANKENA